jgi:hypothetical protein
MPEPKVYVPGQDRKADELAKLYDQLAGSKVAERADAPDEREAKDPFGLSKKAAPKDDYEVAKACAERFTKFFALLLQDFELAPKAALYMAELTFLNIFNADDIPLSKEEIEEARRAAFEYYAKSRPLVPSAKR